ncbi:MAG: gliding motility-associated C-terminal domain-containing protein, partial [Flavobacteriales bacterium]|nr:gliding motility-associated C-terminal domain-containing protein [Flavobacteriales bacterium]
AVNFRLRATINGPTTQVYSNMVNSINLEIADNEPENGYADLSWSPYNAWEDASYEVLLSTDQTNWIVTDISQYPFYTLEKPGELSTVYMRVFSTNEGDTAYSNCVSYDTTATSLRIPDIFTPNGDGINDVFSIKNLKYWPGSYLKVFNRWGTIVYRQEDYQGTWSGTRVADGVYFYILLLNDGTSRNGSVTIIR